MSLTFSSGSVVWTPDRKYGSVYNLQVQNYKGEDYITFWGGNSSVGGHGEGYHYMVRAAQTRDMAMR